MHHKHLQSTILSLQKFSKNSIKHLESLGLGLEHLRKNHILSRTGLTSLERAAARLSEQKDVSQSFACLQLASGSLKRTGYFQNSGQNLASLA